MRRGPGGSLVGYRHHLHQQGRRGAEGAAGADVRPCRQRHLGRHLPQRLRAHSPPGHRAAGPGFYQQFHHLRQRRQSAGDQGHPQGYEPGREGLPAPVGAVHHLQRQGRGPVPGGVFPPGPELPRLEDATDRGDLRRLRPPPAGGQRPGFRRHHSPRRPPAAEGRGGPDLLPAEVPLRPHRRVPGHQPPPIPPGQAPGGGL